jgi:hypothetical protein
VLAAADLIRVHQEARPELQGRSAGARRPGQPRVHRRGSQFGSHAFVRTLRTNGLFGSMGRVGPGGDSAAMEFFFARRQKNVLDRQRWDTREQLRLAIITWSKGPTAVPDGNVYLERLTPVDTRHLSAPQQRPNLHPTSQPKSGNPSHCGPPPPWPPPSCSVQHCEAAGEKSSVTMR